MPRPANPELVDRIVRVTAAIIDEQGTDAVTVRRVAEEAKCSPTVIYHYFTSKDGLLHRAVQQGLDWFGSFVNAAEQGQEGVERIRATARAYVQWGIRNPSMYRLMFEQRLPRPAGPQELEKRRGNLDTTRRMLAEVFAADPAGAPDVDVTVAANVLFTSLHGIVSAAISGRLWGPGLDDERLVDLSVPLAEALVDMLTRAWGLHPREGRR